MGPLVLIGSLGLLFGGLTFQNSRGFLGSRYVSPASIGDQSPIHYWTRRLPSTAGYHVAALIFFQDTVMECSEEPCEVRITLGLCTKTGSTDQYESTHSIAIVNTKVQVKKRLFGATPSKNLVLPFCSNCLGSLILRKTTWKRQVKQWNTSMFDDACWQFKDTSFSVHTSTWFHQMRVDC